MMGIMTSMTMREKGSGHGPRKLSRHSLDIALAAVLCHVAIHEFGQKGIQQISV